MNRRLNFGVSLAAGLLGGLLSHYLTPELVHAQSQPVPPKEITAQSFVLANDKGIVAAVIGFDKDGSAGIKLFDKAGKVIWAASGKPSLTPLSSSISK